ncbi:MAG TPA: carboxypeptidase-like regulatory domain-containing protein, partial [Blastocatellia bacterium]|nr:carboxypeptidase-like regulatory domain-containing protein [Blastocatellia bacterium]
MKEEFFPKLFICVFLSIIAVSVFAQDGLKEHQIGGSIISGRITVDGNPVVDAPVFLVKSNNAMAYQSSDIAATARTDADGHFKFTGLVAGKYGVVCYQPGMVETPPGRLGQIDKIVSVLDGQLFDVGDINLRRGGVITGRVTDRGGAPIVEVPVRIYTFATDGGYFVPFSCVTCGSNLTDDRGVYRQYGLPAGQYLVAVGQEFIYGNIGPNSDLKLTYHPGTTDKSKATIVTVGLGDEISDVNIVVGGYKKSFSVSGKVVDSVTGAPVPNVTVICGSAVPGKTLVFPAEGVDVYTNQTSEFRIDVHTNQTGEFHIDGVSSGEYALQLGFFGAENVYTDPIPFQVIDGDVTGLEIRAITALAVKGTVQLEGREDASSGTGLAGLAVACTDTSSSISRMAIVAPDGSFTIPGLRAGTVAMSISSMNNPGFTLVRIEGNLPINGNALELTTQESATGIKLILGYSPNRIHGRVEILGGVQPRSISVEVAPVQNDGLTALRFADVDSTG